MTEHQKFKKLLENVEADIRSSQRMADSSLFPLIANCLMKSKLGNENCLRDQSGTAVPPAQHYLSDINLLGNVVFCIIVSKSD